MTITVYPVDAVSGAPSNTGRAMRQASSALIGNPPSGRPLGAASGVRPGTPVATVTATSSTWTVNTHSGVLDKETAATAGPYLYAVGVAVTGSMTAADATNPRIDLISMQLSDPAEGDGSSTPGVAVVYTTGTAAATPAVPSTPARSLALAQINVPKSGTGSPSVTWVAPYLPAAGGITPTTGVSAYPASPYVGMYIDDADLGPMRWNGSRWQQIYPSTRQILRSSNINIPTGGSGTALTSGWTNTGGFSFGDIVYSAGTLAADQDGVWELGYMLRWDTSPAANFIWEIIPTVNGSAVNSGRQSDINPSAVTSSLNYMSSTGKVQLSEGDEVGLTAFQSSGSTIQIIEGQFSLTLVVPL